MDFILSKLLWIVLTPSSLLLMLLCAGSVLAFWGKSSRSWYVGKWMVLGATAFFLSIAILPVGDWALMPLEERYKSDIPSALDGIVLLGGDERPELSDIRGQPISLHSMARYERVAFLAKRFPKARIVYSGGSGSLSPYDKKKDFEVALDALVNMGVARERVEVENRSRNTHENALFTKTIIKPKEKEIWTLVTSAWHMPRAMASFRAVGWKMVAVQADYYAASPITLRKGFNFSEQLDKLTLAMHEYVGLVYYRAHGWIKEW